MISIAALRAKMIADHPTFGQVDYAPGAVDAAGFDVAKIGADGQVSNEPFRSDGFLPHQPDRAGIEDDGRVLTVARASASAKVAAE